MNMSFLGRWAVISIITLVIIYVAQGVYVTSLYESFMSSVIIGLLNASIPYLINMFTFSQSIFTLVAFSLLANSFVLYLMDTLNVGIQAESLNAIILTAVMISIFTWFTTLSMNQKLILKS